MKKCTIISDSFKGTLTSREISDIFEESLKKYFPECKLDKIVMSDGGDGFISSVSSVMSCKEIVLDATGPDGKKIETRYLITDDNTAVLEQAETCGLSKSENPNPLYTCTFGLGEQILDAIKVHGCKNFIIGIGGSATNDLGLGALSTLGLKLYDKNGKELKVTGNSIKDICSFDTKEIDSLLKDVSFTLFSDVTNPLLGSLGAAHVFAKQKGASEEEIEYLESSAIQFSNLVKDTIGKDMNFPSAGAGGGIISGFCTFANAEVKEGAKAILDLVGFKEIIKDSDAIFTGEGRLDGQSINGKVISAIIEYARESSVPVICICGSVDETGEDYHDTYLNSIFSTYRHSVTKEERALKAKEFYSKTTDNIMSLLKLGESLI